MSKFRIKVEEQSGLDWKTVIYGMCDILELEHSERPMETSLHCTEGEFRMTMGMPPSETTTYLCDDDEVTG